MKKYILDYIKELESKINDGYKFSVKDIEEIKYKIENFKHERLIHLLVTLFYALFVIGFILLSIFFIYFIVPCFTLIVFLFFYVKHYFFLENSVQYLYKLYDKII